MGRKNNYLRTCSRLLVTAKGTAKFIQADRHSYFELLRGLDGSDMFGLPPDTPKRVKTIFHEFLSALGGYDNEDDFDFRKFTEAIKDPAFTKSHLSVTCTLASQYELFHASWRKLGMFCAKEMNRRTLEKKSLTNA